MRTRSHLIYCCPNKKKENKMSEKKSKLVRKILREWKEKEKETGRCRFCNHSLDKEDNCPNKC